MEIRGTGNWLLPLPYAIIIPWYSHRIHKMCGFEQSLVSELSSRALELELFKFGWQELDLASWMTDLMFEFKVNLF